MEFISKVNPFKKIANLSSKKHHKEKPAQNGNGVSCHDNYPLHHGSSQPQTYSEYTSVLFTKELVWNENKLYCHENKTKHHTSNGFPVTNNAKSYHNSDKDCHSNGAAVVNDNKPLYYAQYDNAAFQCNNSIDHHYDSRIRWHGNHLYRSKSERQHDVAMRYNASSRLPSYPLQDHGNIEIKHYHAYNCKPNHLLEQDGVVMRSHGNKHSHSKEKRRSFVSKSSKNLGRYNSSCTRLPCVLDPSIAFTCKLHSSLRTKYIRVWY